MGTQISRSKKPINLSGKMKRVLPRDVFNLLRRIGRISDSIGSSAYVVGGLVRDLILGVRNLDLDIVVDSDAASLGRILSEVLSASLVVHKRFGTCSVVTKEGLKIDLATARRERYERPGALPTVEFSSLKDDLVRRDFTINAMAVSINGKTFGLLVDFFGGVRDLAAGRIRVMHDLSFIDDPRMIFRAVRFEARFGFSIEGRTEWLIRNAIRKEMFDKVSPERIRGELELILKEKEPFKELERMAQLDELRFLHPKIRFGRGLKGYIGSIEKAFGWYEAARFGKRPVEKPVMYLAALFEPLSYNDVLRSLDSFGFRRADRLRILSYKRCAKAALKILGDKTAKPSKIYRLLAPLSHEVILLIMAGTGSRLVRSRIRTFFERYSGVKIRVTGASLAAMGLKPSPDFKKILEQVLYAKIDGKVRTRKEELIYAGRLAAGCGEERLLDFDAEIL